MWWCVRTHRLCLHTFDSVTKCQFILDKSSISSWIWFVTTYVPRVWQHCWTTFTLPVLATVGSKIGSLRIGWMCTLRSAILRKRCRFGATSMWSSSGIANWQRQTRMSELCDVQPSTSSTTMFDYPTVGWIWQQCNASAARITARFIRITAWWDLS